MRAAGGLQAAALASPPSGFPELCGRKRWRALEKVWATVSGRTRRTGHRKQPLPFSERPSRFPRSCPRDRVPDFVHLELPRAASGRPPHTAALSAWRAPLTPAHRPAGPSVLRAEGAPGPTREGSPRGSGACGCGLSLSEELGDSQSSPWTRGRREYCPWPLEASPKTQDLVSLGNPPKLHVAGKEAALESDGLGFSSCVTLRKSFHFSELISQQWT